MRSLLGKSHHVAALISEDDRSLYEYVTGEMAALDGLTHIDAPVIWLPAGQL